MNEVVDQLAPTGAAVGGLQGFPQPDLPRGILGIQPIDQVVGFRREELEVRLGVGAARKFLNSRGYGQILNSVWGWAN